MKWTKASDRKPAKWDVTFRQISTKDPIVGIWKFHDDCIELENKSSICGQEIAYTDVAALQEKVKEIEKWKSLYNNLLESSSLLAESYNTRIKELESALKELMKQIPEPQLANLWNLAAAHERAEQLLNPEQKSKPSI